MPIIKFERRPKTGRFTAEPAAFEEQWVAEGEDDELAVQTHAINTVPPFVNTAVGRVFLQNVHVDREGRQLYYCTASYGISDVKNLSGGGSFGTNWVISGTTTGGTLKIYACKEVVAKYGNNLPDTALIGIKPDGSLEGTEVVTPCLRIDISISTPMSILTAAYTRLMGELTGTVNTSPWCSYDAGTLLYMGGDFKASSDANVEVVHHVAFQKNLVGVPFAGFTITKRGWDIAWPKYANDVQANNPNIKAKGVYVMRVYDYSDFAAFLGFG